VLSWPNASLSSTAWCCNFISYIAQEHLPWSIFHATLSLFFLWANHNASEPLTYSVLPSLVHTGKCDHALGICSVWSVCQLDVHGIFGSQGMIWWWNLCSASSHLQKSPQEMSFIFWHQLSSFACLPGLWPILLRKSIARVICPSMYAQDFFSTNWSTPYQLSTFQLIRFTLIEALTWHITIRPSQTPFVSTHHKCLSIRRTFATLDKRSRAPVLFYPHCFSFLFFIKKKTIKLPSGTNHLVKPYVCFTSTSGSLYCWWLYFLGWDILSAACAFVKYLWAA
jgi:hypothetical protein